MPLKKPVKTRNFLAAAMFIITAGITVGICFMLNSGMSLDTTDISKGLVYHGMVLGAADGACEAGYEILVIGSQTICTHGPDPAPKEVDVRVDRQPEQAATETGDGQVQGTSVSCVGDGQSGYRIQLVYAYVNGQPNRYSAYASSFQQWAGNMNRGVADSAAKTGGTSQIRFVHDANCAPVIEQLQLSSAGDDSFNNTIYEMYAAGYSRSDRKYMIWMDANVYCGISTFVHDDSPSQSNANNVQTSWSRVDTGCWGMSDPVELHELVHMLGGVQTSAPHSDTGGHCTDEYDRLCYQSVPGATMTYPCSMSQDRLLDCNNDDYFSAAGSQTGYLSSHWNTANSSYLVTAASPYTGSLRHPDGTLVHANGSVYLIDEGQRRPITSGEVFISHGFDWAKIKAANAADLALAVGSNFSAFREGTLVAAAGGVYVIDQLPDGSLQKRGIASYDVFQGLGYQNKDFLSVYPSMLPAQDGSLITSVYNHPEGTLVHANGSVYLIETGQKRPITSGEVFISHGFDWSRIRAASVGDMSLPDGAMFNGYREGTLLAASGGIFASDKLLDGSYQKRGFATWEAFVGLSYQIREVIAAPASSLPAANGSLIGP